MIIFLFLLPFDRVVGVVDNNIITMSDVLDEESMYPGISTKDMLQKIIDEKMLLMEADSETLSVSNDEVRNAFRKFVSQNAQNPMIKDIDNKPALKSRYYQMVKNQLIIQKLIQKKFSSKIYISEGDIRNFYQSKKDSLVIPETVFLQKYSFSITISKSREKKQKNKALKVMHLLAKGRDFASLTEKYSDDINTKYNGGDLGKINIQELPEEFSGASKLKIGEYQLFKGKTGYHIILCVDRGNTYLHLKHIYFSLLPNEKEIQAAEDSMKIIRHIATLYPDSVNFQEIGELPLNGLDPRLKDIVSKLKEGEISKPITDGLNVYIIKLKKRVDSRLPPLSEVHEQIRQILYTRKIQTLYMDYVNKISKKYFIKTNL